MSIDPWQEKPWWCQPWTIILTGLGLVGGSWWFIQRWWLTLPLAVLILLWWWYFLLIYPKLVRELYATRDTSRKV